MKHCCSSFKKGERPSSGHY